MSENLTLIKETENARAGIGENRSSIPEAASIKAGLTNNITITDSPGKSRYYLKCIFFIIS